MRKTSVAIQLGLYYFALPKREQNMIKTVFCSELHGEAILPYVMGVFGNQRPKIHRLTLVLVLIESNSISVVSGDSIDLLI